MLSSGLCRTWLMKFIQAGVVPKTFLSRGTRLVLVGGLTAGVAFGAVTGIASAATGHSAGATSGAPGPATRPGPPGGPMGGPGGPGGPLGGPGGGGTITGINGSTLTLRTLNGTETVETSSSTSYSKEMRTIGFSGLATGEVVHVMGSPVSTGSSGSKSSTPQQPGTGTVEARRITVVEPTFSGRVLSNNNGTITVVGADGQLLTVGTTSSTRYYKGASKTTSSAVTDGARIVAEGTRSGLTTLGADVIIVAPARPAPASPPAGSASPPKPPSPASAAS